jgi:hypothetical protein
MADRELYIKSALFGTGLGAVLGMILGAATGALSLTWDSIQLGGIVGIILGALTGSLTGLIAARVSGRTGGVSFGAYAGMAFGGFLGLILGAFVPASFRESIATGQMPYLIVLANGAFEMAILVSFLLACIGTAVGAWVAGRNFIPREK